MDKKNKWGSNQLRYFHFFKNGDLLYYKDMTDFKGKIKVGKNSKVTKSDMQSITLIDVNKNKEYHLL